MFQYGDNDNSNWPIRLLFAIILLFCVMFQCSSQSRDSVHAYLEEIGVKHSDIVVAQSIEETGWYNCTSCSLDKNNIFGFTYAGKYKQYTSWKESCRDYLKWQNKWYRDGDYYEFLNCIWKHRDGTCAKYATKEGYISRVRILTLQKD